MIKAKIYYHDIGDYLSREEILVGIVARYKKILATGHKTIRIALELHICFMQYSDYLTNMVNEQT